MEEPRRLGGRYELGSVLGRGGMAEVYLAHDTRLGRTVAVKTLRADLARDPSFQARFRREAQSAASLNHPAIVAVYDTGEDYVDGVSIPYIVMEYVDGSTLRELLHSGRKLLPERSLEMTVGILQALEYSHRNGIVHRDIKPANVMLTRTGQVKVMDFGIARAMGDAGMTMTQTAAVIGTAQYLSPEQAKGETVDARSDLYSTGCLLYELLTVRPPFIGDSPVAVAYQHVREEPQPPSVFDPEVTPEMDAIVLKALTKDPDYRYQSADEMRADIEAYLDGQPVAAAAMGAAGYGYGGGYSDGAPTTALPPQDGGPKTSMLPPMGDEPGGYGYDERPDRRRGKKSNTSTILLVVAGVLVLIGAIFIGKSLFADNPNANRIKAPDLRGETLQDARSSVDNVGLKVTKGGDDYCDQDKGKICSQDPQSGTAMDKGQTITVVISKGAKPVEIPDESGKSFSDAQQDLQSKGFTNIARKDDSGNSGKSPGTVLSQDPSAGSSVAKDTKITLTVAAAPQQLTVPDVTNKPVSDAQAQLQGMGFQVQTKTQESTTVAPDTVISQSPGPNNQAPVNSTITLTVAKAPSGGGTVPGDILGHKLSDVQSELSSLSGVTVNVQGPQDENAVVVGSDPKPGSQVQPGQTITLQTLDNPMGGGGDQNNNGGKGKGHGGGGWGGIFGG
ncbi:MULTISPECIES: Stk1 family PASTA domain-containing Ser/Thr kinase [Streptomycetaceae]|uniref:non-specific serine/threonine protein kinase n=1 Tax=Streptantibioticus cattleyicolor (strain ATCC 35852 / DSM 46488 / JCM 4925 / NBRC 14057 / NRRL 8057) TaxID=1003195 RepID=F8JSD6_STREN|nr:MULTISPECIES: Stk1 family PASTA domain-containing Ser/Thr kinase [Streptomycetaceae]AEW95451.1 serine/threonine protein kinase [Streptantibioticus cattleyicolor NRRL 8057 = DSM 46488]MYS60019.1 Stk1 family PASTA domain-containing Ser/Thr kinase [Streptomyces sp. SID5468]CCB75793.1 putative Non-specific serine/threonine protein kinase [Streptantibioticus cattleyicolor NRRL 8057 = DSM 46488]